MIRGKEICVAGAGIGGLAAAVALAQRGAHVRVLEQADAITEVGAGLQISPNGVRVLDALGLGEQARARAVASRAVWLRDGVSGRSVSRMDLAGHGDFLLFHRADLIALLHDAARDMGVRVETGRRVEEITLESGGVGLAFADGTRETVPFLVGADGLHSLLRARLNETARPFFTGQVAWRALVAPKGGEEHIATVFMGPGRHMVTYPLRGGRLINIAAVEERWSFTEESWAREDDPAHLRAAFEGFCDEARDLLSRVEKVFLWGLFRHPVAENWHQGRAVLLGDGAHPTLPFMAQGAVMALEDAWVLGAVLAERGLEDGPAAYQALRRPRVVRVVEAANANARNYHLRNPLVRGVAHSGLRTLDRLAPGRVLGQFAWIYDHDVTVPQG